MFIPIVEMFYSIQGEGLFVGKPSVFIRLFGCNFQCNGFSNQDDQGNIGDIEIRQVSNIEELSNQDFTKGCDSRYSWHPSYKHLAKQMTSEQVCDRVRELVPDNIAVEDVDIIFTGGEPFMSPIALLAMIQEMHKREWLTRNPITFETNGSIKVPTELAYWCSDNLNIPLHYSNSPKLRASGEPRKRAWRKSAIESQQKGLHIQTYKFVVETEQDVEEIQEYLKTVGVDPKNATVFLMPVGATAEQQNQILPKIAELCMKYGYCLSMRAHVYAFGNELGT